jgi:hypothetical protein
MLHDTNMALIKDWMETHTGHGREKQLTLRDASLHAFADTQLGGGACICIVFLVVDGQGGYEACEGQASSGGHSFQLLSFGSLKHTQSYGSFIHSNNCAQSRNQDERVHVSFTRP